MKNITNIILGLILILLGVVIGINSLGIAKIDIFFEGWWTLFIIIPCFIGLIKDEDKKGSIIGLIIGVLLLLSARNILDFAIVWKLIIPIILVIIGVSFIFKDTFNKKVNDEIKKLNKNSKNKDEICATFSSQNVRVDDEFNGINLTSVFGGIKYDLRDAKIKKDTLIKACLVFGGIDILVPENVKVKVKSSSIFGGVDNKSKNSAKDDSYTIYIDATCVFGGVDIK